METNFLRAFLLVADSGSVSEAARRLDLSPAAVARQVDVLEAEFGAALLVRAGRTVRPTDAGWRLIEHGRRLMREYDELNALVTDEGMAGEFRVGAINTAMQGLVPQIMARFTRAHPQMRISIRSDPSDALYHAVSRGDVDVALCAHPPFSPPKTLAWSPLREESLVLMAPPHLADRPALVLLREQPFLRYDRRLHGGRQADRYLRERGIAPQERLELDSALTIALMVEQGVGVSLLPEMTLPLMRSLQLALVPLPNAPEGRQFGMLWPRASARLRAIQSLLSLARQDLPDWSKP